MAMSPIWVFRYGSLILNPRPRRRLHRGLLNLFATVRLSVKFRHTPLYPSASSPMLSHRPIRSSCRRRHGVVHSPPRRNRRCTDPQRLHTSALSRHGRRNCSPVHGNRDSTSFSLFIVTCLLLCSPSPLLILGPYIYRCPRRLFGFVIFWSRRLP